MTFRPAALRVAYTAARASPERRSVRPPMPRTARAWRKRRRSVRPGGFGFVMSVSDRDRRGVYSGEGREGGADAGLRLVVDNRSVIGAGWARTSAGRGLGFRPHCRNTVVARIFLESCPADPKSPRIPYVLAPSDSCPSVGWGVRAKYRPPDELRVDAKRDPDAD